MKKLIIILFLAINSSLLFAQILLTIEGTTVNNTDPGAWFGVNIQRSVPTTFLYRNNSITSINTSGYMLQAGDEGTGSTNNNLDGEIITGNKFIWNGSDMTSITHGIFTGCNINAIIKHNYLYRVPMGIIRKSADNMTNTSGGVAYNIVTNPAVAMVVKGMSNVNIYNNTFYQTRTYAETGRGLIDVYTNTDISPNSYSHGTKIKNNIFYTKYQTINIRILDNESFTDLECDYNLYWCEAGTPKFEVNGSIITFAQWQALGYDTHSKVINPNFTNSTDLVPGARLDYGVNLGTTWQTGLSTTAVWNVGSSPATTNQNGTWQVGARIYDAGSINLSYISSVVENATPTLLEMTYNLSLANIAPAPSAFRVQVNSVDRIINSVAIVAAKVRLTLASAIVYGDNVTVAYTKPASNQLQSAAGAQAASIIAQPVINNTIKPIIDPPSSKIKMTINPNPVHQIINILFEYNSTFSIKDPSSSPQIIRIFDLSGKLFIEKLLETGVIKIQIPINLKPGIYIVYLISGGLQMLSQKIIVY
jgi:hypothetical protein